MLTVRSCAAAASGMRTRAAAAARRFANWFKIGPPEWLWLRLRGTYGRSAPASTGDFVIRRADDVIVKGGRPRHRRMHAVSAVQALAEPARDADGPDRQRRPVASEGA